MHDGRSTILLEQFIRENIGSMFGLGRFVTMNALADVVGARRDERPGIDVTQTRGSALDVHDELEADDVMGSDNGA